MYLPDNLTYKTSNIGDGNLDFRFGSYQEVSDNRYNFFDKNKIDHHRTVCMNVENHKDDFLTITENDFSRGVFDLESAPKVDTLISNLPNSYLMLLTADCLPISIFDLQEKVMALVHVSAQNTPLKISQKIINVLAEDFSSKPNGLLVYFGPSIKKESYFTDLIIENENQLISFGVKRKNIFINEINTYQSHDYFSYRRSEDNNEPQGRFATILGFRT